MHWPRRSISNQLVSQLAPAPAPARAQSYDISKSRGGRSGRGKFRGGWKTNKKPSGGTGKGQAFTKSKSTSNRSSGSSFGGRPAKRGGGLGGLGGGGIGMMPI